MSLDTDSFIYVVCQRGAESELKREVAQSAPELRLAFSHPGFVTFKTSQPRERLDQIARRWTFARACGTSLGKLQGQHLAAQAGALWQQPALRDLVAATEIRDLHVWQIDSQVPGQHGFEPGPTPLALEVEQGIRQAAPEELRHLREMPQRSGRVTPRNAQVLDVALLRPDWWWFGVHRAVSTAERFPGGVIPIEMPDDAPSRAYRKLEEALRWSGLPLRAGEECVELGCAPGGASWALLERGLFVTGVDPAEVDEVVREHPRFRHLQRRSADVPRREFRDARWLVADINVAPQYTLDAVEAIVTRSDTSIRGMILTLKLLDWKLAESLDEYATRIRGWGYRDIRVRQLASNRQEVCVIALRNRALRRLTRGTVDRADTTATLSPSNRRQRSPRRRVDDRHPQPQRPHF